MTSSVSRTATVASERRPVTAPVYLGLGSNLGDRRANLAAALHALPEILDINGISAVYESEPVGYAEQPYFWNLVVRGRTRLSADELLGRALEIERDLGRRRTFRGAPRTLDIDILLYGDAVIDRPGLHVPHPRLAERSFVLAPLAELEPELRPPGSDQTVAELLNALPPGKRIRRLFPGDELLRR